MMLRRISPTGFVVRFAWPFLLLLAACASTTTAAQTGGAPTPENPAPQAPTTIEGPADVVSDSGSSTTVNSSTPTDELGPTTDLGPIDAAQDWIAGRYETHDSTQFAGLVDPYSAGVAEVGSGYLGVGLDPVNGDVKVVASEDGFLWKPRPSPIGLPATSLGPFILWPMHEELLLYGFDSAPDEFDRMSGAYFATSSDGLEWKILDIELDIWLAWQNRASSNLGEHLAVSADGGVASFTGPSALGLDAGVDNRVYRYVSGSPDAELIDVFSGPGYTRVGVVAVDDDVLLSVFDREQEIVTTRYASTGEPLYERDWRETFFDNRSVGGNLIIRSNSRFAVSLDEGRSYELIDGPSNDTWLQGRWDSFGAIGSVEPGFGDAEYIEMSGNGIDWSRVPVPPNTKEVVPLSLGRTGLLALMRLDAAGGDLLIKIPW